MIYLLLAFLYILFISLSGIDYQNSTTGFHFVAFTIFFIIFFSVIYYAFEFVAFLLGRYRKNVPWYSKKRNILLALLMVCTPLNLLGFCYSQFKFYSDEEFIRIGISDALKRYNSDIKRWREGGHKKWPYLFGNLPLDTQFITYSTVDDFIKNNPNCCAIKRLYDNDRGRWGGTYFDAIIFNYHVRVDVRGDALNQSTNHGAISFSNNIYIQCCGRISSRISNINRESL